MSGNRQTDRVHLLLGRALCSRAGGGWTVEALPNPAGSGDEELDWIAGRLRAGGPGRVVLIHEPAGMDHAAMEAPRVGRRQFLELARIREGYPELLGGQVGWGMEPPWRQGSRSYRTVLHREGQPALRGLRDRCAGGGVSLSAAWSLCTVVRNLEPEGRLVGAPRVIAVCCAGYVGITVLENGACTFRHWQRAQASREGADVLAHLGEVRDRHAGRRVCLLRASEGKPTALDGLLPDLEGFEAGILAWDALAGVALALEPGHPANLLLSFEKRGLRSVPVRRVSAVLAWVAAGAALADAAGVAAGGRMASEQAAVRRRTLVREIAALERARSAPAQAAHGGMIPLDRARLLREVGLCIPGGVTLTGLVVDGRDNVLIEAEGPRRAGAVDALRLHLQRRGFILPGPGAWSFDPRSGTIRVRCRPAGGKGDGP